MKGENAKIIENRAKRDSRHVYCTFWPKYTFCGSYFFHSLCFLVHGLEKVSLAALLSGYLGKSGHLPRFFFLNSYICVLKR